MSIHIILDKISMFLSSLSAGQIIALVVAVAGVLVALKAMRKVASILSSIASLCASLYFFAPGLFSQGVQMVKNLLT